MKHRRSLIAVIFTALVSLFFASCNHNLPAPMYGPCPDEENPGQETQNSTNQDSDATEIPE